MIKHLICCLFVTCTFAQTAAEKKAYGKAVDHWEFMDAAERNPKLTTTYLLANGKPYDKTYLDSLKKQNDYSNYKQEFYLDSLQQKATIVLVKRTDGEVKKDNRDFFKYHRTAEKERKRILKSTVSDLSFVDMDGKTHSSESFKGNLVFLNFWFTKCAPCIKEMPDLNALRKKYKDYNVLFYAITYDDRDMVNRFLKKQKLDFTVISDQRQTVDKMGVKFFPTNMLMDEEGKIVYINEIFNPKTTNGLSEIEKILAKRAVKKN